ncbi:MAG: COQ9 family protein, partial [Pseudomonadota bacterium]
DRIWRGLGDKSTDFNFYSKRTILSGVWSTTFARWLADDTDELEATKSFLADRIANVMQIEKFKAQVQKTNIDPLAPLKILSKIRYRQSGARN